MFGSTYSPKTALKHAKEILERVKDINKKWKLYKVKN
jgi:hypothetical protein